jgi:predicted Ser/Thr protein kinase
MQPDRFAQLRELFEQALPLNGAEREAFLQRVTAADPALGFELENLLQAHARGTDRLSQPAQVPDSLRVTARPNTDPSMVFGSYRVMRELGRGGMGTVYLAVRDDDTFRKTVALKVIRGGVDDEDFIRRFKQERQILAALDHPHIARILDGGTTPDNRPYFVMEFVEGQQIDSYCDTHKCGLAERIRLFVQVLSAVQYLHDNNVIHRDLKPSNILVDKHGHAKLLDFGIAKIQGIAGLPSTREMMGAGPTMMMTPGYASPEQIEGKPATRSSDIYSLGVILYQILTGKAPFTTADNTPNLAAQLAGLEPPAPSTNLVDIEKRTSQTVNQFRKRLVGDLDRIVLMSLRRDPARRYASASHLADDLNRFLNGDPVMAQADSPVYRAGRQLGRNRALLAVVLLVLCLAGVGIWQGVRVYVAGVRAEARQSEVERLLSLLDTRLNGWSTPAVAEKDKVADVQIATALLKDEIPQLMDTGGADLERCKGLLDRILRYLSRADQLAVAQPAVRKEIVVAYRQAADLQGNPGTVNFNDKIGAVTSYQQAANIASSLQEHDELWAREQLVILNQKVAELGATLEAVLPVEEAPPPQEQEPAAPVEAASAAPATPVVPRQVAKERTPEKADPAPPAPSEKIPQPAAVSTPPPAAARQAPAVSNEEVQELQQRLSFAISKLAQTRKNVEDLRSRLQQNGQIMRSDIPDTLNRVESFLQMARSDLQRADTAAAKESLQRVEYELRRLAREVGN